MSRKGCLALLHKTWCPSVEIHVKMKKKGLEMSRKGWLPAPDTDQHPATHTIVVKYAVLSCN